MGLVKFGKDQSVDAVIPHKASNRIGPVLPNTASKIAGYAGIKRTIASARKDVNTRAFLRRHANQWALGPRVRGDDA